MSISFIRFVSKCVHFTLYGFIVVTLWHMYVTM